MKCTFCEHELSADMLRSAGCGTCIGGCRKIHCPYCGQENPVLPEIFDRLLGNAADAAKKGRKE